jgi:3-dehydroquinate dehydratase-2
MKIIIINGPNLNLLGKREPEIYGTESFESYFEKLKSGFSDVTLEYYQSNVEGEIVNKIQEKGFSYDGIIINAASYSHTSVAIADAIAAVKAPVIEVHISNVFAREKFRHNLITATSVKGVIAGFGLDSYRLALVSLTQHPDLKKIKSA